MLKYLLNEETVGYKIVNRGIRSITDVELVCALLQKDKNTDGMEVAKKLMIKFNGNFKELCGASIKELMSCGLTMANAKVIQCAAEISRRYISESDKEKPIVKSSKDAFYYIYQHLSNLSVEHFYVLYLNKANHIIDHELIGIGGMSAVHADKRVILRNALSRKMCCGIILCHNHPSGNIKPSDADKKLTEEIYEAGEILDIKVLDHLIVADSAYYSFSDEGML